MRSYLAVLLIIATCLVYALLTAAVVRDVELRHRSFVTRPNGCWWERL